MPVDIAIAVVRQSGRVLIGQRPEGVPLAGCWEFPGGKVHPEESPEEAACRECMEETGLAIRLQGLLGVVDHAYPHAQVRLHFFAADPLESSGVPSPPFRWVAINELNRYRFPPANMHFLESVNLETAWGTSRSGR